ncbi:hypothetical protein Tco_0712647, partial [Tanacetum coccineum]
MYFCAPKVDIGKILKPLRNDSELANFVKLAFDNGCKVELYVEHHGYHVIVEGVTPTEEVVDEELDDEMEMEDISEYVGLDHVVEEDVDIPNTGLNDTFLNKLVDGKYISHTDFRAKVDKPKSSSSKNVDDSSVDDIYKHLDQLKDCLINYRVRRNDYRNISVLCGKNVKEGRCSSQKGKQKVFEDIGTPKSPKFKKGKSKKSLSPKTPKSPIATPNADAAKKDVREKFFINDYKDEILSTNLGSTVQLDVDTMDDRKTQFKRMYIFFK